MTDRKIYKILLFLKRREGMSVEDFRDYYENVHVKLCAKYVTKLDRYIRRYIDAHPTPETADNFAIPFDVITEMWFYDEATFKGTLNYISTSLMPEDVIEDEKNLLDRKQSRMATVVEYESDLAK